jgi:regulator of sigma E protease
MILLPILSFVFVLSFLVIIHELGHYFTAKFFNVHVEEFGLGYPPRALKLFALGSTLFSLNWIPFGGFVRMEGEDGGEENIDLVTEPHQEEHPSDVPPARGSEQPFYKKSIPARLMIILAGASVNFVFGVLAFSIFFSVKGIPQVLSNPRIGEVAVDSPAAKSHVPVNVDIQGVQIGEKFYDTASTETVSTLISEHLGEHVTLVTTGPCAGADKPDCDMHLQEFDVYLRKESETPEGQKALGITFEPVVIQKFYPWPEMPLRGAVYGLQQALILSYLILTGLGQIAQTVVHGHVPAEVAGPVGIFSQANDAGFFSHGLFELLNFAGLLSVNLAVMNVLPIPALDGGRVLFLILEVFVGKKRIQKIESYANYGGFAVLLFLIALITLKDVGNLFHH